MQILETECDDTEATPSDQRGWQQSPGLSAASDGCVPSEDAIVGSLSNIVIGNTAAFGDQFLLVASIIDALESEAKLMVRVLKCKCAFLLSMCLDL